MKPLSKLKKKVVAADSERPTTKQTKRPESTLAVSPPQIGDYRLGFAEGGRQLETVALTPRAQAENDAVLAEVGQLPEQITEDSDEPAFIDALARVKDRLARLEDAREKLKRPFLEAGKKIDACAKEARAPLEEAQTRITGELGRVEGVRRRVAREEERRLRDLATQNYLKAQRALTEERKEKFNQAGAIAQHAADQTVRPTEGLMVRLSWRAELLDAAAVMASNPQLLTVAVRQSSVNDMIRSLEERGETIGPDTIPGIRLYPITSIGTRRAN